MKQQLNFLLKIQSQLVKLSRWQYFQPAVVIFTVLVFFVLGRKTYQSKFSNILNIINDSQNEKRRLKQQLQQQTNSLKDIRAKLVSFRIFTLVCIVMVAIYLYLHNFKTNFSYLIWGGAILIISWMTVLFRIQFLEIVISRTQKKLQRKTMSSESDIKQVMHLLGETLCSALKNKFERELHVQQQQQGLKECDLKRCSDEKKNYKQLYQLYKTIITEMQQMSWCDICSMQLNTEANDLKISQIQSRIKNYKSISTNLSHDKKKELTNRLLEEWQRLQSKLPKICKRGCCIKFRVVLQQIKKSHHSQLSNIKGKLQVK